MAESSIYSADIAKALDNEVSLRKLGVTAPSMYS